MREYKTQMEAARKGIVTEELKKVAQKEHLRVEELMPLVAAGKVAICANKNHKCLDPQGVGSMLRTKINVNLGVSRDWKDYDIEMQKVMAAVDMGVGIVGSDLEHEGLEAVGVVEDELAALFGQLDVGVLAGGVFADVVLDDPVNIDALGGERLGGGFLTADEVVGVALVVLVADADQADLDGLGLGFGVLLLIVIAGSLVLSLIAAGNERQHHDDGEQDRKKLLHLDKSSLKIGMSLRTIPLNSIIQNFQAKRNGQTKKRIENITKVAEKFLAKAAKKRKKD